MSETLRERIRQKLHAGELPRRAPFSTWGGDASGQTCDACDEEIAGNGEIEVDSADSRTRYFHPPCYRFLAEERAKLTP